MSLSPGFKEFLEERFAGFGPVTIRRMFGGAGVFLHGRMFALVADDTLYFKAGPGNEADFDAEDLPAITYEARGRTVTLSYRQAPERVYDDPDELVAWARKALEAAESGTRGGRRKGKVRRR